MLDAAAFAPDADAGEIPVSAAELAEDLRGMKLAEYILLKADIEAGQGAALNQPWLDEKCS